jgi:hypothetical protein
MEWQLFDIYGIMAAFQIELYLITAQDSITYETHAVLRRPGKRFG